MEIKKDVNLEVKMISAVNQALSFRKKNPKADDEAIMKHIALFASQEKNSYAKLGMIASVARTLKILQKEDLADRVIIKRVMAELPEIINNIE